MGLDSFWEFLQRLLLNKNERLLQYSKPFFRNFSWIFFLKKILHGFCFFFYFHKTPKVIPIKKIKMYTMIAHKFPLKFHYELFKNINKIFIQIFLTVSYSDISLAIPTKVLKTLFQKIFRGLLQKFLHKFHQNPFRNSPKHSSRNCKKDSFLDSFGKPFTNYEFLQQFLH